MSLRGRAGLLVVLLLAACSSTAPSAPVGPAVDPLAAPFLAPHGHVAAGPSRREPVEIGDPNDAPWSLYLEVSRAIGLDFGALAGRSGELVRTPIAAAEPNAEVIVLVVEGRPVGAWISPGGTSSGVMPVDDHH